MRDPVLPNTTVLLVGFVVVMLGAVVYLWNSGSQGRNRAVPTPSSHRLDLNTTSADALRLLPGIGPGLARRIVQTRHHRGRFDQVEQLQSIPGIGPRVVTRVRPWVTCDRR